jgi:polyhydroxyalkanoate synthesis regulator phasin
MLDILKKTTLTGIGLALKTWDEVEDIAKELQKKGKMTETEGKKFLEDLQDKYQEVQQDLEDRVDQSLKNLLKKADIVTEEDLKALKKEIRDLKKAVSELAAQKS